MEQLQRSKSYSPDLFEEYQTQDTQRRYSLLLPRGGGKRRRRSTLVDVVTHDTRWVMLKWERMWKANESDSELAEEGKLLVKDYIHLKLKQGDLLNSKLLPLYGVHYSDVSREVQRLGSYLEQTHPKIFSNLCKSLNMTMTSEDIVSKCFNSVAKGIFFADREEAKPRDITWGKVVALFSVAGGLAIECAQQGHSNFVATVVDAFTSFLQSDLVNWIRTNGGWTGLIMAARRPDGSNMLVTFAVVGVVFGMLAALTFFYIMR